MSERPEHYAATTHPTALTTAQQHWAMTMRRVMNALKASEDRTGLLLDAVIVHRGVDGELAGLDAHLRVEVGYGQATEQQQSAPATDRPDIYVCSGCGTLGPWEAWESDLVPETHCCDRCFKASRPHELKVLREWPQPATEERTR